ncbi:MAG: ATP synthase F1 subunit delta [Candidatus Margulisbacteria bacterium]|nr:ATP synthase F1 subunit delta [Candidatus Margulisiibacteriota bacterium]
MKNIKIVSRYADAFIRNIPKERYDEVAEYLKLIAESLDEEVIKYLVSDIVNVNKRLDFLEKVDQKIGFPQDIKQLLVVLVRRKRLNLIKEIYSEYVKLMNKSHNMAYVTVETKYQLSAELLKEIKVALEKRFKQEIAINEKLNPEIIAGVIIKKDDFVMDLSVNGRLKIIKSKLMEKANN